MSHAEIHPPRTMGEKYARATITSDLSLSELDQTDADRLLAAGFAAMGNRRGQLALALWRLEMNHVCTERELLMLQGYAAGKAYHWSRQAGRWALYRDTAHEIAETVLHWWLDDVCPSCHGRKVDLIPGTQLTSANPCQTCSGFGKAPVESRFGFKRQAAAVMLADDFKSMLGYVFGEMAARLANTMDMPDLSGVPLLRERLDELRSPAAQED